jgi:hypothetical protein
LRMISDRVTNNASVKAHSQNTIQSHPYAIAYVVVYR